MISKLAFLKSIWNPIKTNIRRYTMQSQYDYLEDATSTQRTLLSNGLVVASEERQDSNTTCIGFYVNVGARHEHSSENGITHLFEHLVFKGTKTKSKRDIEKIISKTGARFGCFTTREISAYYAVCLHEHIGIVSEILFESVFRNELSESEIEVQKQIICHEMLEQDNTSQSVLFDYLHSTAFQGTGLGQTIMGPSSNLHTFNDKNVKNFLKKYFVPYRTVLASVGCINHEQIVELGNSCFTKVKSKGKTPENYRYTGSEIKYRNDSMKVAHVAVAVEGSSYTSKDRPALELAAYVVGGWDRSQPGGINHITHAARAASSGLADCYKPFHFFYKDTGLWGTQYISPKVNADDMMFVVQDEWMKLCNMITDMELIGPKTQLKANILSRHDSVTNACHDIGTTFIYTDHRQTLAERLREIDKISANDMKKVCQKYIYDKCPVLVSIGATECVPDYCRARAGMYWLRI